MDVELGSRISAAWNSFHRHRDTLCCKSVSLSKRIKLLKIIAEPALFWCAGTWKLTYEQCSMLRGVQREMLMKMMRPRRRDDEVDEVFFPRLHSQITSVMTKSEFCSWDLKARDYYFKWAGSVARMGKEDSRRLTSRVLHFLNIDSIRAFAKRNHGDQGHGRRLHVWRWESDVHDYGAKQHTAWEHLALNSSEWLGVHLETFRTDRMIRNNLKVRTQKRSRLR